MQDTETVNEITTVIAEMRKNHSIRQLLELVTSMLIQSLAQEIWTEEEMQQAYVTAQQGYWRTITVKIKKNLGRNFFFNNLIMQYRQYTIQITEIRIPWQGTSS